MAMLTFVGVSGGLYLIDEPNASRQSIILKRFPQLSKSLAKHDWPPSTQPNVLRHTLTVDEASFVLDQLPLQLNDESLRAHIAQRCLSCPSVKTLCEAYVFLTCERGFWINHGGMFGVDYLLYTSPPRDGHSTYLCVVTHSELSDLECAALTRLARTVGKRVLVVQRSANGSFSAETVSDH